MNYQTPAKNDRLVAALDIGTTKICAIVGRRDAHGRIEILGLGKVESQGVRRGVVANIEKTVDAIKQATLLATRKLDLPVHELYVGIAGQHIRSLQHRGLLTREDAESEIAQSDIDRLKSDMYKIALPPGDRILHVIPQNYTVDDEQGIKDPVGMAGARLEANFHIVTGQITASKNIERSIERAGRSVSKIFLEPIGSGAAVLTDEETQAGVALIDIGGGTTDLTIFHDGRIRHTAVIPFGGNVITKDIKEGCSIIEARAEDLKRKYGSAFANEIVENRIITIPGLRGHDPKEISEKNLARIIQSRVEEILDFALCEIQRSGYSNKLIGGCVITGGGSLLRNIKELCDFHTGLNTRIGYPNEKLAHGYVKALENPIYATAIGLLIKGLEMPPVEIDSEEAVQEENILEPLINEASVQDEPEMVLEEVDEATVHTGRKLLTTVLEKTKLFFSPADEHDLED